MFFDKYFRWNIFFKKQTKIYLFWRLLRWWLETVWIPFLPFFYLFEKICELFMFTSNVFYIFRDKIRIWIKKNWWRLLDFFGLRRVFFLTRLSVFCYHLWCQLLFFSLLLCKWRENSNELLLTFQFKWGKIHRKVGNPARILSTYLGALFRSNFFPIYLSKKSLIYIL